MLRAVRRLLLLLALALVAALSAAAPAPAQDCPGAADRPDAHNGSAIRRATLCLLNRERAAQDLPAIRADARLEKAARRHSDDMVRKGYFEHSSPSGDTLVLRASAVRYVTATVSWLLAENIAWGTGARATPRATVRAWMQSPPHRANILSRWAEDAGIGVALGTPSGARGATYTLDFGRRS